MSAAVLATLVVAHHLSGPIALAFAVPPILVVVGTVLWLRRYEPDEDEEFEWASDAPVGPSASARPPTGIGP